MPEQYSRRGVLQAGVAALSLAVPTMIPDLSKAQPESRGNALDYLQEAAGRIAPFIRREEYGNPTVGRLNASFCSGDRSARLFLESQDSQVRSCLHIYDFQEGSPIKNISLSDFTHARALRVRESIAFAIASERTSYLVQGDSWNSSGDLIGHWVVSEDPCDYAQYLASSGWKKRSSYRQAALVSLPDSLAGQAQILGRRIPWKINFQDAAWEIIDSSGLAEFAKTLEAKF